jgi:hypothetical protein
MALTRSMCHTKPCCMLVPAVMMASCEIPDSDKERCSRQLARGRDAQKAGQSAVLQ